MPVSLDNSFDDTTLAWSIVGGALPLATAMFFINYGLDTAKLKDIEAWDMRAFELAVRILVIGAGYTCLGVATYRSIDALGLQAIDDVEVELICCYILLGVSAMAMYFFALNGTAGNIVAKAKQAKNEARRRVRIVRKGGASAASAASAEEGRALKGEGVSTGDKIMEACTCAPTRKTMSDMLNLLFHAAYIAGSVWLFFILADNHTSYAVFSFLVASVAMLSATLMCVNYLTDPTFFKMDHFAENYQNHLGRFFLVAGGFFCFAILLGITVRCEGVVL